MKELCLFKRLEEVCLRVTDGTHQSPRFEISGIPFLVISNIAEGSINWDSVSKWVSKQTYDENTARCRPERGDVLYTAVGSFGIAAPVESDQPFMFQRHIAHIKPDPAQLHTHFLAHVLNSPSIRANAERVAKGAAQRTVTLGDLKAFQIPVPPLPEQRRIADILDKADAIRRKRKQAIALTEELLRSAFLEMFGDPVTNPKGWEVTSLDELCSEIVDCPHSTPIYTDSRTPHPCIRTSDLQNGFLDWSTTKFVNTDEYSRRIARLKPQALDIVYSREGERFGIAALIPFNIAPCLGQRMMLFRAQAGKATPEFLWATMNSTWVYQQAVAEVGGSTSPHVNVKAIKKFRVFNPPLSTQAAYSAFHAKATSIHKKLTSAAEHAGDLFFSVQQAVFPRNTSL